MKPPLTSTGWTTSRLKQHEFIRYTFVAGLTYILLFTPINMLSYSAAVGTALILYSIAEGSFFRLVWLHKKTLATLLLFLFVSAAHSPLTKEAITGSFNVFKGLWILPVAVLASDYFTEMRFRHVAIILSVTSAVIAQSILWLVVEWQAPYDSLLEWSGSHVGNIHNLANFFFMSLLLAGILTWQYRSSIARWTGICSALALIPMCMLVKSEGSYLALAFTILLLAGLKYKGLFGSSSLVLASILVILLQLFYALPEQFSQVTGIQATTLHIRSQIYGQLLEAWSQHPLIGWGAATYKYVEQAAVDGDRFLYPHNLYLEALFSLGAFGVILLSAWLLSALRKLNFRRIVNDPALSFALAILAYFSVKGMSDMKLMSYHTIGVFSICLGILVGSNRSMRSQQKPREA